MHSEDSDVQEDDVENKDGSVDSFCGHTTIVFYQNGTSAMYNHINVNAEVAANLLGARDSYSYYSPVEMKHYAVQHPNLKIFLKRNRVHLKVNKAFQSHFNVTEKGPVVVYYMNKAKSWGKTAILYSPPPTTCEAQGYQNPQSVD